MQLTTVAPVQLTVIAEWTQPTPTTDRLAIAGYTAVVEEITIPGDPAVGAFNAYQYTVLRDHFEIVEVGKRLDRRTALGRVELVIRDHIAALS